MTIRRPTLVALILCAVCGAVLLSVHLRPVPTPYTRADLVPTVEPMYGPQSWTDRAFFGVSKLFSQGRTHYQFGASPTNRCSVQGLLNQSMAVTGTRYLIAQEVLAASVPFGTATTLDGPKWVASFENALETQRPEWWDPNRKTFVRENLVLIRWPDPKTVLVLTRDLATEFQRTNHAVASEGTPP